MSAYEELLTQGNTEFAFALYQQLRTTEGNLFFSPYSISAALAMTCAGARRRTAFQMLRTLCLYLPQQDLHPAMAALTAQVNEAASEEGVLLRIANSLWPQQALPVLDSFTALMQEHYGAALMPVDYQETEAARHAINTWVEQETEGKIQDLIPVGILNAWTDLVLVNAIYFKGTWASRFDQRRTRYEPFWISPDSSITVPMMSQTGRFNYLNDEGLQILELPYAGNKLSMLIVLPEEKDGLAELEQRLTAQNVAKWSKLLFANKIMVVLPKFALSFPFRLDSVLKAMGMTDAFSPEEADFSGIISVHQRGVAQGVCGGERRGHGSVCGNSSRHDKVNSFRATRFLCGSSLCFFDQGEQHWQHPVYRQGGKADGCSPRLKHPAHQPSITTTFHASPSF